MTKASLNDSNIPAVINTRTKKLFIFLREAGEKIEVINPEDKVLWAPKKFFSAEAETHPSDFTSSQLDALTKAFQNEHSRRNSQTRISDRRSALLARDISKKSPEKTDCLERNAGESWDTPTVASSKVFAPTRAGRRQARKEALMARAERKGISVNTLKGGKLLRGNERSFRNRK